MKLRVAARDEVGSVEGVKVERITLENKNGMSVSFLTYGATLHSIKIPSRDSATAEEITLNFEKFDDFIAKSRYYGSTVGRVCNRIAKGTFHLNGKDYKLAINNGVNALHGGLVGFDKRVWPAVTFSSDENVGVKFVMVVADMEEGYPASLELEAAYFLTNNNELIMTLTALNTSKSLDTIVNMTNHAYFNLSGGLKTNIYDHVAQVCAQWYLPVDDTQIPTGEIAPVAGTPFDLREPCQLSKERLERVDGGGQPGYDHCFAIRKPPSSDGDAGDESKDGTGTGAGASAGTSRELVTCARVPHPSSGPWMEAMSRELVTCARVHHPSSGRWMEVSTTQPGVQLYTGNFLARDPPHAQHWAFCLETQHFPNAVNEPKFESVVVPAGKRTSERTVFRFGWDK